MLDTYSVTFAGHREVDRFRCVEEQLDAIIADLLRTKEFVEFYVGNDGDFDVMAVSAIRRARNRFGTHNSAINLVLPYQKANIDMFEKQFDSVMIPSELHGVHPKNAITARNRWMVEQSNLLICYVKTPGGAANTLKFAKTKMDIAIKNLAEMPE